MDDQGVAMPLRERKRRALALLAARLCHPSVESNARHGLPPDGERRMRIGDVSEKAHFGNDLHDHGNATRSFDPNDEAATAIVTPESVDSERGGRRRGKKKVAPSSPSSRCLLSRWLPSKQFLNCRVCEGEYDEEGDEVAEEVEIMDTDSGCGSCVFPLATDVGAGALPSAGRDESALASASDQYSEHAEERKGESYLGVNNPEQTFLNVGVGASLVLLLTGSITEFNKLAELRREMEILLKEFKDAARRRDPSPNPSESSDTQTFPYSDSWGDTEVTQQSTNLLALDCLSCFKASEVPTDVGHDGNPKRQIDHMDAKCPEFCVESELESEFEVLKLSLDERYSEEHLKTELSDRRTTQVSDGSSVHLLHIGAREKVENENGCRYEHGVCPRELTRRLHDLLEARQEERITELESALQLAHIKLREKEMEASWWRDAARLASQQNLQ